MVPLGHLGKSIIHRFSFLGRESWPRQVAGVHGGKQLHMPLSLRNNAATVVGPPLEVGAVSGTGQCTCRSGHAPSYTEVELAVFAFACPE